MAQKVQVVLLDDLDGGEASETMTFSLDGASYEIDLSAGNAATLREALAPYVGVARRTSARRRRPSSDGRRSSGRASGRGSTPEIRAWARANGYQVSDRGRINSEVLEAYEAAN